LKTGLVIGVFAAMDHPEVGARAAVGIRLDDTHTANRAGVPSSDNSPVKQEKP